jgi:small subunit ribosomal protein S18
VNRADKAGESLPALPGVNAGPNTAFGGKPDESGCAWRHHNAVPFRGYDCPGRFWLANVPHHALHGSGFLINYKVLAFNGGDFGDFLMARRLQVNKVSKRRAKSKIRTKKKDPIFVEGRRPRPMYVDYKDVELLKKLTNRQGKIISRRKSGCTAVSQHAVTKAIKRARFMALLPYTGE